MAHGNGTSSRILILSIYERLAATSQGFAVTILASVMRSETSRSGSVRKQVALRGKVSYHRDMESPERPMIERIDSLLADGAVPHNTALGLSAVECSPGEAILKLPYAEHLVGNPETGVLHGGAVTSLLDATAGLAVLLAMKSPARIATLDLRIDYLGPAEPCRDLLARAECYKLTRNIAFVRGVAYHDDPGAPIASATATFMIFPEDSSTAGEAIRKP